jgi:hypothetical protein
MDATAELFARAATQGNFRAEHWAEWKSVLDQMDPVARVREHLIIERTDGIGVFSLPVETLYQRYGRQTGSLPGVFTMTRAMRRFAGQDMAEMVQYLDYMERSIADVDRPYWEMRGRRGYVWRAPTLMSANFLLAHIVPASEWMLTTATELKAYQRILMTVCDVEMFRAEQGGLRANEVWRVPTLARIDPFNGQPLRFVMKEDGYSIYSVGPDGDDDGGVRATGRQNGDIAFHLGKPPERSRVVKRP